MKLTVEIDDDILAQNVTAILVREIVADVRKSYGDGYAYRKDTKEVMREVIKENMDDFAERAIAAAAKSIENRAIKAKVSELLG